MKQHFNREYCVAMISSRFIHSNTSWTASGAGESAEPWSRCLSDGIGRHASLRNWCFGVEVRVLSKARLAYYSRDMEKSTRDCSSIG